jgi:hypothetical protein
VAFLVEADGARAGEVRIRSAGSARADHARDLAGRFVQLDDVAASEVREPRIAVGVDRHAVEAETASGAALVDRRDHLRILLDVVLADDRVGLAVDLRDGAAAEDADPEVAVAVGGEGRVVVSLTRATSLHVGTVVVAGGTLFGSVSVTVPSAAFGSSFTTSPVSLNPIHAKPSGSIAAARV